MLTFTFFVQVVFMSHHLIVPCDDLARRVFHSTLLDALHSSGQVVEGFCDGKSRSWRVAPGRKFGCKRKCCPVRESVDRAMLRFEAGEAPLCVFSIWSQHECHDMQLEKLHTLLASRAHVKSVLVC